jgi:tRNA modification GTPase
LTNLADTIVALSTPQGEGAIGVIRLSGSKAISICDKVFNSKKLANQATHTAHFGTIKNENGSIIDEVLVTIFKNPKSYTGEDVCEVSCHGSSFIIQQILQLFVRQGARTAQPGEFTLRAFLNGKMDLSQAEAVADLIASESASSHTIAMNQMRGGITNEISKLRQELIDFAALIELELDFGEEDVEFADRDKLKNLIIKINGYIKDLMTSFDLGNAIKQGINTVIAGRPNAGKSTLLNVLLNEERAIVSEIAGTTRDTIEETLNINGVTFRLIDTAGIRDASDKIEVIGVKKTMEKIQQSTLLIYVFDVTELSPEEVIEDIKNIQAPHVNILLVANKMDLNPYTKPADYISEHIDKNHIVATSALNNMNIEYLKEQLYQSVLDGKLNLESTIVSNARHYDALQGAYTSLQQALDNLTMEISGDFVAMDIRHALRYLGEITGEISSDDLLESIFSRFCIGK